MIVIVGVILLVAAVVTGVTGVVMNSDDAHALTDEFSIFGYAVTGSTGTVFFVGIVVGAAAVLGLALVLSGTTRERRQRREARGELREVKAEAASVRAERDDLRARVPVDGAAPDDTATDSDKPVTTTDSVSNDRAAQSR